MPQPKQLLDALALAGLEEPALIRRVAAIWCRQENRTPYNRSEVAKWVKREFGPLLDLTRQESLAKDLTDECKLQLRLRRRRALRTLQSAVDPCNTPAGSDVRVGRLLNNRLGPARRWVSQNRMLRPDMACSYIDADFHSGLVAGLIPVKMRLQRISDPNLLVYRQGWSEAGTVFVPNHITTVADAFLWLIPTGAHEFLSLPSIRVEHDGEEQAVRLTTPWGVKTLPWRGLSPYYVEP